MSCYSREQIEEALAVKGYKYFAGDGDFPEGGLVGASSTTVAVYDMGGSNDNTAYNTLRLDDLGTGANNNTLYIAGFYHTT